jgi:hypothetical protein
MRPFAISVEHKAVRLQNSYEGVESHAGQASGKDAEVSPPFVLWCHADQSTRALHNKETHIGACRFNSLLRVGASSSWAAAT